ncbi:hypothetical protein LTR53_009055 [Teratosphaeriaceae sp. CCFEE 6253]|nr:hypothetical protein LTR53_009055 [Teratosphaeriaceae sp. CCFEE 6253]
MARTRTTTAPTGKPGLVARLRNRNNTKVTTKTSTNPITGAQTTTKKTTTHPQGLGHHGHGGRGPMASTNAATTGHHHTTRAPATHHQRKPSMGDKVSGALMKLRGSLTGRSGVKAAGTRRMHGTDGKGSHRAY